MSKYKVEENNFVVPPEDSYWLDLAWIQEIEGDRGPYLKWWWTIADVEGQHEYAVAKPSSQTSLTPTLNNRFGAFLNVLLGGIAVDDTGSTDDLIKAKFRVKGFVEHNKKIYDGEERTFLNVTKLIEGTSSKGGGIGCAGVPGKFAQEVNVWLEEQGLPPLPSAENSAGSSKQDGDKKKGKPAGDSKKKPPADVPW
jgi:hypothetical protein